MHSFALRDKVKSVQAVLTGLLGAYWSEVYGLDCTVTSLTSTQSCSQDQAKENVDFRSEVMIEMFNL